MPAAISSVVTKLQQHRSERAFMNSAPSPSQSPAAGDGIDQIAASVRSGQVVLFLGAGVHASKPALPGQPNPPPDPRRPLFAGALAEALAGETRWTERFPNKPPKDHFQRVALYYELNIVLDEQLKDWEQKGKAQVFRNPRIVPGVPLKRLTCAIAAEPGSQMLSSAQSLLARHLRQHCARWQNSIFH